ncbi:MAG: hypothetical protein ACKVZH_23815 [Blastocatellia bacterium]
MSIQLTTIQVEQNLADALFVQAQASGLSLGDYLKTLMLKGSDQSRPEQLGLAEIDLILDQLSEGTEQIPALPQNFSRADIYFDHD